MTFVFEDEDLTILRKAQTALHKDELFARRSLPAGEQAAGARSNSPPSPAGAGSKFATEQSE